MYFRSRDSNIFKVAVNVAARSKIDFNLTYQELLQRRFGVYEHVINIDPGQVVRDLQVEVYIRESREITLLRVPPIRSPTETFQVTDPNAGIEQYYIHLKHCKALPFCVVTSHLHAYCAYVLWQLRNI